MDELIREYAETLRIVKVGDFTYEGILAEFARKVIAQSAKDSSAS